LKRELGAAWALLALAGTLALLSPRTEAGNVFLSWQNLSNILTQVCVTAVMAAGCGMVIIGGGIDLSVGSVSALSAALAAGAIKAGAAVPLALIAGVATGCAVGAVNGGLVALVGLPPFIATL
jgi:ribose transport system permease protein